MSSWKSIQEEIARLNRPDALDVVRREKMKAVQEITGRSLIVYATDFITPNPLKAQFTGNLISISLADKDGFDEVTRNLSRGSQIDVLLHSPGGSAEATESIVALLRDRFSHIRFIIPSVAKSAARNPPLVFSYHLLGAFASCLGHVALSPRWRRNSGLVESYRVLYGNCH